MLPRLPFAVLTTGRQLLSGAFHNAVANILTSNTGPSPVIATPAGTAITSVQINNAFTEIGTVVSANDGVVLPQAKAGLRCTVTNNGANSAQVFANGNDVINAVAGNVGVALAAGATAEYVCRRDGFWIRYVAS